MQLTDKYSRSPNGKLLAYFYRKDTGPWRVAVASQLVAALLSDNRQIAYVDTQNGVSNVVAQSLDGGKPKLLTDFKQERIFSFDYSRDGKQFALSRGTINNDVVLIGNFNRLQVIGHKHIKLTANLSRFIKVELSGV